MGPVINSSAASAHLRGCFGMRESVHRNERRTPVAPIAATLRDTYVNWGSRPLRAAPDTHGMSRVRIIAPITLAHNHLWDVQSGQP